MAETVPIRDYGAEFRRVHGDPESTADPAEAAPGHGVDDEL
ncbi:hypothetical protein [Nocardia sp. X0981]